jgi:hypothetical protein
VFLPPPLPPRPDIFLLIQVPDDLLVERVVGRRSDPVTGEIYHLTFKPPPAEVVDRLVRGGGGLPRSVPSIPLFLRISMGFLSLYCFSFTVH